MENKAIEKLINRIKRNWGNRKWIIYGATFAFLLSNIIRFLR